MPSSGKGSNTKNGPGAHPGGKSVGNKAQSGRRGSAGKNPVGTGKVQQVKVGRQTSSKGSVAMGVRKAPGTLK